MNIAVILSGGVGSRMGAGIPKQYVVVGGKPVVSYCLGTFLGCGVIDALAVVRAAEWADYVSEAVSALRPRKPVYYALPGETRQYSVLNALREIKGRGHADGDVVVVHDAARPLVSAALIRRVLEGCAGADGAMPAVPLGDTVYESDDGRRVKSVPDRGRLWAGQSPEAFRLGRYLRAHEAMPREELLKVTGSMELAFKGGLDCRMVEGDPANFKITRREDLARFAQACRGPESREEGR